MQIDILPSNDKMAQRQVASLPAPWSIQHNYFALGPDEAGVPFGHLLLGLLAIKQENMALQRPGVDRVQRRLEERGEEGDGFWFQYRASGVNTNTIQIHWEIQKSDTIQIQGQTGQFPAAAKNLSAELLPIPHQATAGVTAMMKIMKNTKIERYIEVKRNTASNTRNTSFHLEKESV